MVDVNININSKMQYFYDWGWKGFYVLECWRSIWYMTFYEVDPDILFMCFDPLYFW